MPVIIFLWRIKVRRERRDVLGAVILRIWYSSGIEIAIEKVKKKDV
jgi:hypothetical protein